MTSLIALPSARWPFSPTLFTGALPPPAPGQPNTESFNSQVDLQVSTDGGNTHQSVRVAAPVQVTVASQVRAAIRSMTRR